MLLLLRTSSQTGMGFIFNDITSGSMGIKARLTSWQVCGKMRNFTTTVPGKYGVADFGADFDYREITVHCNIYPTPKADGFYHQGRDADRI